MSPYDFEDDFSGGGLYGPSGGMYGGMYGLTEEDKKKARNMGLMSAGLGILAANQPSPVPQSPLGALGKGGLQGLNAYQGDLRARMGEKGIASNMAMNDARMKFGQQAADARTAQQQATAAQQAQLAEARQRFASTLTPEQRAAFEADSATYLKEHNKAAFKKDSPEADPFAKISPKDYTPESIAKFRMTKNQADLVAVPKEPLVKIDMGQDKFWDTVGTGTAQGFTDLGKRAEGAVGTIRTIHEGRNILDQGMVTGFGADFLVSAGQALKQAGFNFAEDPTANSQAYSATMAKAVGENIKLFGSGTGLSNADREYAEKMAAGKITLDEKALRTIQDINEKQARWLIQDYNKKASKVQSHPNWKNNPIGLTVEEPEAYKPKVKKDSTATMTTKPPAHLHKDRTLEDSSGKKWKSDGMIWKPL
jgi:hypothetical protein